MFEAKKNADTGPTYWEVVSGKVDDGTTLFCGNDCERRAHEYAAWKNGDVERRAEAAQAMAGSWRDRPSLL